MSRGWVRAAGSSVALIPLLLVASTADAVEAGFYAGGNYGQSSTKLDIAPFDALAQYVYTATPTFVATTSTSQIEDEKDQTYSFLGGYRFSRHWALEASYVDFGKRVYRDESSGTATNADGETVDVTLHQKITTHSTALTVTGLAILPLSYRAELFARAGVLYGQNDVKVRYEYLSGELRGGSNSSWLAGVGGSFTFADIYAVRLEYQRNFGIGHPDMQESDMDLLTLGVTVTF